MLTTYLLSSLCQIIIMMTCLSKSDGYNLTWEVDKQVLKYGEDLSLFCHVDKCCVETAGWIKWTTKNDFSTLFIDVKDLSVPESSKYSGKINKNGFFLVIRKITRDDFNVNYSCTYGFHVSKKKMLLETDAVVASAKKIDDGDGSKDGKSRPVEVKTFMLWIACGVAIVWLVPVAIIAVICRKIIKEAINKGMNQHPPNSQIADIQTQNDPRNAGMVHHAQQYHAPCTSEHHRYPPKRILPAPHAHKRPDLTHAPPNYQLAEIQPLLHQSNSGSSSQFNSSVMSRQRDHDLSTQRKTPKNADDLRHTHKHEKHNTCCCRETSPLHISISAGSSSQFNSSVMSRQSDHDLSMQRKTPTNAGSTYQLNSPVMSRQKDHDMSTPRKTPKCADYFRQTHKHEKHTTCCCRTTSPLYRSNSAGSSLQLYSPILSRKKEYELSSPRKTPKYSDDFRQTHRSEKHNTCCCGEKSPFQRSNSADSVLIHDASYSSIKKEQLVKK